MPRLPAPRTLHHIQDRACPQCPPAARPASRRPPDGGQPGLAGRIPPLASPGRAGDRLARRPRQPPRPLPGHHQEQHLAPPPGRRPQPPQAGQPRAHPHQRRHLGTRTDPGATQTRPPGITRLGAQTTTKIFSGLLEELAAEDASVPLILPFTGWLPDTVERDSWGFILTGPDAGHWPLPRPSFPLETSLPGVFAVGDVRHGSVKRIASAVGEGSIAIRLVHDYLALTRLPRQAP